MSWTGRYRASRRAHPRVWVAADLVEGAAATAVLWVAVPKWIAISFACIWLSALSLTLLGYLRARQRKRLLGRHS